MVAPDLSSWASITDLVLLFAKMKLLASLPKEAHAAVVRRLWMNVRRVPPGTELIGLDRPANQMFVILDGEAQAIFTRRDYIVLLPGGSHVAEANLLQLDSMFGDERSLWQKLVLPHRLPHLADGPSEVGELVASFLAPRRSRSNRARFEGCLRVTREALVTSLGREELWEILKNLGPDACREFTNRAVRVNMLHNVSGFPGPGDRGAGSAVDVNALSVVCEGPGEAILNACTVSQGLALSPCSTTLSGTTGRVRASRASSLRL